MDLDLKASYIFYRQDKPKDQVEINYFLVERKEYGDYTIVIEIDKKHYKQYSQLAESQKSTLRSYNYIRRAVSER